MKCYTVDKDGFREGIDVVSFVSSKGGERLAVKLEWGERSVKIQLNFYNPPVVKKGKITRAVLERLIIERGQFLVLSAFLADDSDKFFLLRIRKDIFIPSGSEIKLVFSQSDAKIITGEVVAIRSSSRTIDCLMVIELEEGEEKIIRPRQDSRVILKNENGNLTAKIQKFKDPMFG